MAILALIACAAGCGPSFYERCLLGTLRASSATDLQTTGYMLAVDASLEHKGTTPLFVQNIEALCAELDARRRER